MKLLDAYYRYERLGKTRSKSRYDLVAYTETYEPLHNENDKGRTWVYLDRTPFRTQEKQQSGSGLSLIRGDGRHISSLFVPEPEQPDLGCGDVKYTSDTLLVRMDEDSLEIFIARGKKDSLLGLFHLFIDGELDAEIEALQQRTRQSLQPGKIS